MSMKYKLEYIYSKLNIYTFKLECIYIYVCVFPKYLLPKECSISYYGQSS